MGQPVGLYGNDLFSNIRLHGFYGLLDRYRCHLLNLRLLLGNNKIMIRKLVQNILGSVCPTKLAKETG